MEQYQTPVLKIYGDMNKITLSTIGSLADCFGLHPPGGDGFDAVNDTPGDVDGGDPIDGFDICSD